MNSIRIALNGTLTVLLIWGGMYLLMQDSFYLRDRWHPEAGTTFSGVSLYLLAGSLFCFGAFAAAVALAWVKGSLLLPTRKELRAQPTYQGQIIIRYWYIIVPAFILLLGSFLLAST